MNVDLPQPDGPINAVTRERSMSRFDILEHQAAAKPRTHATCHQLARSGPAGSRQPISLPVPALELIDRCHRGLRHGWPFAEPSTISRQACSPGVPPIPNPVPKPVTRRTRATTKNDEHQNEEQQRCCVGQVMSLTGAV